MQLPETTDARTLARMRRWCGPAAEADPPAGVARVIGRVQRLLEGERDAMLDVPLDYDGVPPFQRRVYELARAIPPGQVRTYGELARELGEPGAARAVGQALGANPFAPIVPCHRILAAHGAQRRLLGRRRRAHQAAACWRSKARRWDRTGRACSTDSASSSAQAADGTAKRSRFSASRCSAPGGACTGSGSTTRPCGA